MRVRKGDMAFVVLRKAAVRNPQLDLGTGWRVLAVGVSQRDFDGNEYVFTSRTEAETECRRREALDALESFQ